MDYTEAIRWYHSKQNIIMCNGSNISENIAMPKGPIIFDYVVFPNYLVSIKEQVMPEFNVIGECMDILQQNWTRVLLLAFHSDILVRLNLKLGKN